MGNGTRTCREMVLVRWQRGKDTTGSGRWRAGRRRVEPPTAGWAARLAGDPVAAGIARGGERGGGRGKGGSRRPSPNAYAFRMPTVCHAVTVRKVARVRSCRG